MNGMTVESKEQRFIRRVWFFSGSRQKFMHIDRGRENIEQRH